MKLAELYAVGEPVAIGNFHFSADDIIRFARKFDPQPFHTDANAAKDYVFGALCASGWHTCSAWMRCFLDFWAGEVKRLHAEGKEPPKLGPSPGFHDLRWFKPVFAGDTIQYSTTLLESRPDEKHRDRLLLTLEGKGVNQHGDMVLRFKSGLIEFI